MTLTIRTDNLLRRSLRTGIGGLPGVEGTTPAHPGRFCPRGIEGAEAIHEQRSGGFRPGQDIKGQQEYLGVPEHMSMIIVAGQRPGADRHALVRRVGGAVQMVDSEPQCLLCGGVAVDFDVAAPPAACPGRLVFRQHAAPAEMSRNIELVSRPCARVQTLGIAPRHGDSALETHNLPGAGFPAPGPFQLVDGGRRKSWPSTCSDDAVAMARLLPERWVRHTPRS